MPRNFYHDLFPSLGLVSSMQEVHRSLFPSLGLTSSINEVHRNLERSLGLGFASQALGGLTSSIESLSGLSKLGILNSPIFHEMAWVSRTVGVIEKAFGQPIGYQNKLLTGLFSAFESSQQNNMKQVNALLNVGGIQVGSARYLEDLLNPFKNSALFGQGSISQINSIAHQISRRVEFQVPDVTPRFLASVIAQAHSGLVDRLAATNIARAILVADKKFGEATTVDAVPEGHQVLPSAVVSSVTSGTPVQVTGFVDQLPATDIARGIGEATTADAIPEGHRVPPSAAVSSVTSDTLVQARTGGESFSEATTNVERALVPPSTVTEHVHSSAGVSESGPSPTALSSQKESSLPERVTAPSVAPESPVDIVREITEQLGDIQLLPKDEVSQAVLSLSGRVADIFTRAFTAAGSVLKQIELIKWLTVVFAAIAAFPALYHFRQMEMNESQTASALSQAESARLQTEYVRIQTEVAMQTAHDAKASDGNVESLLARLVELQLSCKSSTGNDAKELRIIARSSAAKVAPSSRSKVIRVLPEGQLVEVIEVRRKWVLVQFYDPVLDSHQRGWIMKKGSKKVRLDGLQVVRR
jgi:hypothetical protein